METRSQRPRQIPAAFHCDSWEGKKEAGFDPLSRIYIGGGKDLGREIVVILHWPASAREGKGESLIPSTFLQGKKGGK